MTWYFKLTLALIAFVPSLIKADVSVDNLRGEAYSDVGELVHGDAKGAPIDGHYLTRFGASITATDTIKEHLRITVGVGGLFWQPFPPGDFWQNTLHFGPGINEMSTEFFFTPNLTLEGGYFPFKYSSSNKNLGEYLLRTESYPTYLATGGWTWVDSAHVKVLGMRLKASHFDGAFHHEIGVYWEYQNSPLFDLSPTYLFSWRPAKGVEIGGGLALKRWFSNNIAFRSDSAKQKDARPLGTYLEIANFPEVQNHGMVQYSYTDANGIIQNATEFAVWRPGMEITSSSLLADKKSVVVHNVAMIQDGSPAGTRKGVQKFLLNTKYSDGTNCWDNSSTTCVSYYNSEGNLAVSNPDGTLITDRYDSPNILKSYDYTRSAINLMARIKIDFAELLDWKEKTGPFNLYSELAILGVKNQPVYYENILNRMPVMVGLHVPTFGLLDLLAVETEYLDNPYRDSEQQLGGGADAKYPGSSLAVPDLSAKEYAKPKLSPSLHKDDWKWSLHAVKTLIPGFQVKLQAANDHMRLHTWQSVTLPTPQTVGLSQWYYLVHLQWGF
jgi:hypothetical protein